MKSKLIFIAGTKGGVGKSFASVMLSGAAMDLELSLTVYDTDNENRTICELMPNQSTFLDELQEQYPLDTVINGLFSKFRSDVTIVDMKAGTSRSTQEWFLSVPWDMLKDADVDVYVVGCVTSDPDSVRTFVPWLNYFRNIDFPVQYLIVKNEKDGDHFYTCASLLEPAMEKLQLSYQVFNFPAIEQEYINDLNNSNLTLRSHLNGGGAGEILPTIMQKSRLRKHYFSITDQLVEFFAQKLDTEEITEARSRLLKSVEKRTGRQQIPEKSKKTGHKA